MLLSALAMRALGWRSPAAAELRIADMTWPLLVWGRYLVAAYLVRIVAGALLRATPLWAMYLRLNGARVGRGVFINSLQVSDHNLLELGDGVVIGSDAHVSGHTVEGGVVKTGAIRLGRKVTIGVGSVIGIDVEIGPGTLVGALSLVPKHRRLDAGAMYAGVPAKRVDLKREYSHGSHDDDSNAVWDAGGGGAAL
jgi:non-ribosomal peptide synthetase-like protein